MQPAFAAVRPWTERERLKEEKTAIGFFLSGHPFHAWAEEVRRLVSKPLASLEPGWDPVWIAGVATNLRTKMGNRGKMAFVEFDDGTAQVEVLAYSEVFEAHRSAIVLDEPLFAEVKVSPDDYSGGLRVVAERFATLAQLREERARALALTVALERTTPEFTAELESALRPHLGGRLPLALTLHLNGTEGTLRLPSAWTLHPQESLLAALRAIPGVERVEVRYA
jgi:DNA polymerase-3 subunit alpha